MGNADSSRCGMEQTVQSPDFDIGMKPAVPPLNLANTAWPQPQQAYRRKEAMACICTWLACACRDKYLAGNISNHLFSQGHSASGSPGRCQVDASCCHVKHLPPVLASWACSDALSLHGGRSMEGCSGWRWLQAESWLLRGGDAPLLLGGGGGGHSCGRLAAGCAGRFGAGLTRTTLSLRSSTCFR